MREVITITADEIVQSIQRYEGAMQELSTLLQGTDWDYNRTVSAFERWAERRGDSWQCLFIEAKHVILKYGKPPWEAE